MALKIRLAFSLALSWLGEMGFAGETFAAVTPAQANNVKAVPGIMMLIIIDDSAAQVSTRRRFLAIFASIIK